MWMCSVASDAQGASDPRDYFHSLTAAMNDLLVGGEVFTCEWRAEDSTFVRFNHGRAGQAGEVRQRQMEVDLIAGRRHSVGSLTLCGEIASDLARTRELVAQLRAVAAATADDPFLTYNTDPTASSEQVRLAVLPARGEVLDAIGGSAADTDLVGLYAAGGMHRGFANSLGQRNWHSVHSFHFDWSLFDRHGGAAKSSYAGIEWNREELTEKIDGTRENLRLAGGRPRELRPGKYRVYLAPAALFELMSILAWDGFGLRGKMTKSSPFLRMHQGAAALAASIHLTEDIAGGAAPPFEKAGFSRPQQIRLIEHGRYAESLVSPRSAMEFGVAGNGADGDESPLSLDMAAGDLDARRIAETLHTGLLVSNLWYLNFSDRPSCRTTGMTRFATLWVENGRVQGPVDAMRFDDSVYRILGDNLSGLTRQREWIVDADTYHWRSCKTARLPGALVDDFALTL